MIRVVIDPTYECFRDRARELLSANIPPAEVIWTDRDASQFSLLQQESIPAAAPKTIDVPRRYVELAKLVYAHSHPECWHMLYSVLWRILHGDRNLLSVHIDSDVLRLNHMRQEIARDVHHMHAFLRFRRIERNSEEWFVAWYKPDHHVLRLAVPFFVDRFATMRWAILTPEESGSWDGIHLNFGPGVPASEAPTDDSLETLWSTYYRTTFNPARMNLELMRQEMPARFWTHMPELQQLSNVIAEVPARLEAMDRQQATSVTVPDSRDLTILRDAASRCTGCDICRDATQTVFGEGSPHAQVVLVGEQPGDVEDTQGRPFVGPAGDVLRRAMEEAGITREDVYMTNAVKHFKFTRQGKRRIHQTARMSEVIACKPWLEAELDAIRPKAIVLLGSTAAKSLLGSTVRITRDAGKIYRTRYAAHTIISVHPSFVLRSSDDTQSRAVYQRLVDDLRSVRCFVRSTKSEIHSSTAEQLSNSPSVPSLERISSRTR
ncbi:MAG TPA: UdgX family uracil-DNA binding protein [Terriglobales bacterium]|nr:UdgX family uracil-DNA binding protein [Terriglobales bacterium]